MLTVRRKKLPPIYDEGSHWYKGWYLDLRLEEELSRSKRYNLPMSVLVFFLTKPVDRKPKSLRLNELLSEVASHKLRRSDIPAVYQDGGYAVALPHTRPEQADLVAKRLARALVPYSCTYGAASYPLDGREPKKLLMTAKQRALGAASRDVIVSVVQRRKVA